MHARKPKPKSFPPQVKNAIPETAAPESSTDDGQFEVELYWCIHQLQAALQLGKLSPKQTQDHTKALNSLMNNKTSFVQKRQIMRMSFGDYRKKMADEEKKYAKANMKVKVLPGKPDSKSVFVKKATTALYENGFKFNFEIPQIEENLAQQIDVPEKMEVQRKSDSNFSFLPSDNSFKFNFSVTE